jgi:DNA-binding NarL/FixJ family response regulator
MISVLLVDDHAYVRKALTYLLEATDDIQIMATASNCPRTRVMTLSMFDTQEHIHRALDVGALGYVLKDEVSNDLLAGIRSLSRGTCFFSERIVGIAEKYLHKKRNDGSTD